MRLEFLGTDKCFLALIILGVLLILWSWRNPPTRQAFIHMFHRPLAVSSGIMLLFFLTIGVLDSIHLVQTNDEVGSSPTCLDRLLSPLDSVYEKTYSAPLALQSFISETQLEGAVTRQVYPRLVYPPAAINSEAMKKQKITDCVLYALYISALFALCLGLLLAVISKLNGHYWLYSTASITVIFTCAFLLFAIILGYTLSRSFHVLGTGQIGEDMFYFTLKSIRTGLVIGVLTTLFMLPLALFLGVGAGYFGGRVDDVIQYVYTTLSSIPGVLLITASVLSLQTYISSHPEQFATLSQSADARLLALCFILGVTSWTSLCRLLRAEALKLREVDYVMAARALGSNWWTIMRKHLLPNVMHIVIITLVLDFSFLVLAEAVLSYVGVGVSPMTISWGNMINGARLELAREPVVWWPMLAAFLMMFLLVLALNLFADAVRDAFDPQQATR